MLRSLLPSALAIGFLPNLFGQNLLVNPSFEDWCEKENCPTLPAGQWRAESLKTNFGQPLFAALGRTNACARTGRYSFYMKDIHSGASNGIYTRYLTEEELKPFLGKGLKFSAWIKLVEKSSMVRVGVSAICACRQSPRAEGVACFPEKIRRTDGFEKLTCYLRIPEDAVTVLLNLECARGYWGAGEAYFDDLELSVIPSSEVPETAAERERRLRKPFAPNQEAIAWARAWCKGKDFSDDGRNRPHVVGGNFVNADGSYCYLTGPWINDNFDLDWRPDIIRKHGIDHPAYQIPPSKKVFDLVGCNTAQMSGAPNVLAEAMLGLTKDLATAQKTVATLGRFYPQFEDMPLTVDFAFGPFWAMKARNPGVLEEQGQKHAGWCEFIPLCPESKEGDAYYSAYFETGVKLTLGLGLNVGIWELFNESVYGCECATNKLAFCREAERRYGTLAAANAAWGTNFKTFDELARTADWKKLTGLRYEWSQFVAGRYAQILEKYKRLIRSVDHRPNVYFTEQVWGCQVADGMTDYRKIRDALDLLAIEGGWSYGGGSDQLKAKSEMEAVVFSGSGHWYTLDWFAALTRGKKPVVNNELYCQRFEKGKRVPSRAMDLITTLWLEFFHGLAGTHAYVWEKRGWEWSTFEQARENVISPSYKSAAFLNPYNWPTSELDAFKRFRKEFEPWQARISAFPRTVAPSVAIYHSQVASALVPNMSMFRTPMLKAYASVLHAFYPVTFLFDDELVEDRIPEGIEAIVVPSATFETEKVRLALERFAARGGLVILDSAAFSRDEHGRKTGKGVAGAIRYEGGSPNADKVLGLLAEAKVRKTAELVPLDGKGPLLLADVQVVERENLKLVLCVDYSPNGDVSRRVRLSLPVRDDGWRIRDVISGRQMLTSAGEPIWSADDLAKGVEIEIPNQQRVLVAFER